MITRAAAANRKPGPSPLHFVASGVVVQMQTTMK